jgi:hypothetical protein
MFQSKEVKNIVEKLTNIKNGQFDLALGQYFFKQEKVSLFLIFKIYIFY